MMSNINPNEIKKALECCSDIHFCSVCPYYLQNKENDYCKEDMSKDALAYINQLEAEVERLKGIINKDVLLVTPRSGKTEKLRQSVMLRAKEIKSEAIKEFVERLKRKAKKPYGNFYEPTVFVEDIDNLVKEMVGDE